MADLACSRSARLIVDPNKHVGLTLYFDPVKPLHATDGSVVRWEIAGVCYRPDSHLNRIELGDDASALPADASHGLVSPKVQMMFPDSPGSGTARFSVTFDDDVARQRPWLRLKVGFADGATLQIGLIHLTESCRLPVAAPYVSTVTYGSQRLKFYIADETDEIQGRHHANGIFYELEILDYVRQLCPRGELMVDVGANVGNHSVYFDKIIQAREIVAFEPNTPAREVLQKNIALNDCRAINMRYCEYGVGDAVERYKAGDMPARNWGATHLISDMDGAIKTMRLDDALAAFRVALIKIDVEGMEAAVLRGAARLIAAATPIILVEITPSSASDVTGLLDQYGYRIERTFSMYRNVATLIAVPTKIFASR